MSAFNESAMGMKGVVGCMVSACLALAAVASAEGPQSGTITAVAIGEKVALTTIDGERVEGRLRTITPDLLTLDLRHGPGTIDMRRVQRIVVKDSVRNGLLIGLAIGAGAGITAGALLSAICFNEVGNCYGTAVLFSLGGAAGGAAIGAGLDGLRHRTAFERRPEPSRSVELVIDLSHPTQAHSSAADTAPHVTAHVAVVPAAFETRIRRTGGAITGSIGVAW